MIKFCYPSLNSFLHRDWPEVISSLMAKLEMAKHNQECEKIATCHLPFQVLPHQKKSFQQKLQNLTDLAKLIAFFFGEKFEPP